MLILDLYSENEPQWQRTRGYAGRPWIWCQLHDFGGNMNLFGQITNITIDPVKALNQSSSLVGYGLTPEGYEGNEVVYDLLLDQAWSQTAIDTKVYFEEWAALRYGGSDSTPQPLRTAWEVMRRTVYDNRDPRVPCAGVGVYQLAPRLSGMVNRTGHSPAPTALHYDPKRLIQALGLMLQAAAQETGLWDVPAFQLDLVDVTRQVMSNAFIGVYQDLVEAFDEAMEEFPKRERTRLAGSSPLVVTRGQRLLDFLDALDQVLSTNRHFTWSNWLQGARHWAQVTREDGLFSFNARSQITVWNWESSSLNDYAARAWSGLIKQYYRKRWSIFIDGLTNATMTGLFDEDDLSRKIRAFERAWQYGGFPPVELEASLQATIEEIQGQWPDIFKY